MAPSAMPVSAYDPVHACAMNSADIRNFRKWYRRAAINARDAGYDIIYVYAGPTQYGHPDALYVEALQSP
jgi:dimethylamine/trimethylamine dehydrogenase